MNVIKNNKYILVLFFVLLSILISCNIPDNNKDYNSIISILIDREIKEDIMYVVEDQVKRDRLFIDGKFVVAVYDEMTPIQTNFGVRKYKSEYKDVFEKLQSLKENIKFNVKNNSVLKDVLIKKLTPEYRELFVENKHFRTFHIALLFSRISIIEHKAMVVFSSYGSSLDGSSILYYLKKVNGEWKIIDSETLSIS